MDWIQFTIFIGSTVGLFFWNRSESRSDIRHAEEKLESTKELVKAIHQEGVDFRLAMLQESKDFHGRLCAIEERNKK
jgi:hypothetical protein